MLAAARAATSGRSVEEPPEARASVQRGTLESVRWYVVRALPRQGRFLHQVRAHRRVDGGRACGRGSRACEGRGAQAGIARSKQATGVRTRVWVALREGRGLHGSGGHAGYCRQQDLQHALGAS